MAPNGPAEVLRMKQAARDADDGTAGTEYAWPNTYAGEERPPCGWRGFAIGDGCLLPEGHDGEHAFNVQQVNDYYTDRMTRVTAPEPDAVDHPAHYNQHPAGIECIDVVEAFNFNLGNAIKYIWRAGLKPDASTLEDLSKAAWYIQREIERIERIERIGKGQRYEGDE